MLDQEEYVEQAHFFGVLRERLKEQHPMQDTLGLLREEILSTTKLPLAIDFLGSELRHSGMFSPAMARLAHYFTPFQTYVISEAENDEGRFDLVVGLEVLEREAAYRAKGATAASLFLYEFEVLCRNRLSYDRGLEAVAADPIFDEGWRQWISTVQRQIGIVEFADLLYVRSETYRQEQRQRGISPAEEKADEKPVLFGDREGRIARASRQKDPLLLFSALHRQLGYPSVPRPRRPDESAQMLPQLLRRVNRLESRLKMLEEEQRGGIDLEKFYGPSDDETA
ncbi:MAG: hypothetical protein IIA67_02790 [Planctomycetes bacterium]|nr:hypothetical protein [Planctomycetota bacterium]